MSPGPGTSTVDGLAESRQPLAVWLRRVALLAIAGLVAVSLSGWLGVRTVTQTSEGAGYRVSVTYPAVARAGLDSPWRVRVTRSDGLGAEVVIGVTGDWFGLFEAQAFHPEPTEATRDGSTMYLTFATLPGSDTFVVDFDAYLQPASQRGGPASVSVVEGGVPVVGVDYRTRLLP